jgi:hypothetical protein
MTDSNNDCSRAAPSGPSKMGVSDNRDKNIVTARNWLNRYLMSDSESEALYTNNNYPKLLSSFTDEHVEGDHLTMLLEAAGVWLASNAFRTRQNSWLEKGCKKEFFKNWVIVLTGMFPHHPSFKCTNDWFPDILKRFMKHCVRSRLDDPAIADERKSEPLYRNVSENKTAVRAKYHGASCQINCEFTTFTNQKNMRIHNTSEFSFLPNSQYFRIHTFYEFVLLLNDFLPNSQFF